VHARHAVRTALARVALAATAALVLAGCRADDGPLAPNGSPRAAKGAAGSAAVTHRSLAELLGAQGTYCAAKPENCFPIMAPLPELIVWVDAAFTTTGVVDYTGVADAWLRANSGGRISLGTTVTGTVTERALRDGRAEIHAVLHFKNALAYAGSAAYVAGDPVFFGATAEQVLAGAEPVLASGTLVIRFIVAEPGMALPDLVQVAFDPQPGQEVLQVSFHAQARGTLHAASGFAEGTFGQLSIQQVGVFHTGSKKKANDPFTAERVSLHPIGR
jgi:hypothetical protein